MKLIGVNIGGYFSHAKDFSQHHLNTFITEEDIVKIKIWNFNCLRLPVDFNFFENQKEPYDYIEERLQKIEEVLHWAQKYNMITIFDLHKAPGDSFETKGDLKNDIWNKNSQTRKRYLKIWEFLAKRFKNQRNIIYELLNEPVASEDYLWYDLAKEAINIIRSIDETHNIIIDANQWAKPGSFYNMPVFNFDKLIYSFHYYKPHWVTHQKAEWIAFYVRNIHRRKEDYPGNIEIPPDKVKELKVNLSLERFKNEIGFWDKEKMESSLEPVLEFREKNNVPIFCGEFGCIAKADPVTRKNWIEDLMSIFKENKISYTYWNYKNMDFGLFDFTEKYANNSNYLNEQRLDTITLKALQNAIF